MYPNPHPHPEELSFQGNRVRLCQRQAARVLDCGLEGDEVHQRR